MAERIQMRRTRGWRKPDGAVYVGRPTRWGNPFKPDGALTRQQAVDGYRRHLAADPDLAAAAVAELAGHDLACWCPLGVPCHADVLLEVANRPAPVRAAR